MTERLRDDLEWRRSGDEVVVLGLAPERAERDVADFLAGIRRLGLLNGP